MAIKYTIANPRKITQIGIFCLKWYHLATLAVTQKLSLKNDTNTIKLNQHESITNLVGIPGPNPTYAFDLQR
jgi:hypothetical protein